MCLLVSPSLDGGRGDTLELALDVGEEHEEEERVACLVARHLAAASRGADQAEERLGEAAVARGETLALNDEEEQEEGLVPAVVHAEQQPRVPSGHDCERMLERGEQGRHDALLRRSFEEGRGVQVGTQVQVEVHRASCARNEGGSCEQDGSRPLKIPNREDRL